MAISYHMLKCVLSGFLGLLILIATAAGQAINPMMYGMGMYMNPYYTGFYGGFGNMGHMNPLGYQISSGMAIPGMGGQQQQQNAGYGGGYGGGGYGAGSHLASSSLTLFFSGLTFLFSIERLLTH